MSLWIRKKERTGRRTLFLIEAPWEIALLLLGVAIALFVALLRRFI